MALHLFHRDTYYQRSAQSPSYQSRWRVAGDVVVGRGKAEAGAAPLSSCC